MCLSEHEIELECTVTLEKISTVGTVNLCDLYPTGSGCLKIVIKQEESSCLIGSTGTIYKFF